MISIRLNSNAKNVYFKLMVFEKAGTIRIYNLLTLQEQYTLVPVMSKIKSIPVLSTDWCRFSPQVVTALTSNSIVLWNTAASRYYYLI